MPNQNSPIPVITSLTKRYIYKDPATPDSFFYAVSGYTYFKMFAGVSNPRYKQQILARRDAGTNYTATDAKLLKYDPTYVLASIPFGGVKTVSVTGSTMASSLGQPDASLVSACTNEASTAFYRRAQARFSAGTVLGEMRETLAMLRKPALALRRLHTEHIAVMSAKRALIIDKAKRRGWHEKRAIREYRRVASDSYLEATFGWAPLMSDIEGLYQTLLSQQRSPRVEHISGTSRAFHQTPRVLQGTGGTDGLASRVFRATQTDTQVNYKGAVLSRIDSSVPLLDSLGILPEQFVPVAWELTPWSFAIDYFTNVGDVLNAWATAKRLRYVYCSRTVRLKTRFIIDESWYENGTGLGKIVTMDPGLLVVDVRSVSRAMLQSVPLPDFEYTGPLSERQALNLGALAQSKIADFRFRSGLPK